jgi:hypothetical protein
MSKPIKPATAKCAPTDVKSDQRSGVPYREGLELVLGHAVDWNKLNQRG